MVLGHSGGHFLVVRTPFRVLPTQVCSCSMLEALGLATKDLRAGRVHLSLVLAKMRVPVHSVFSEYLSARYCAR